MNEFIVSEIVPFTTQGGIQFKPTMKTKAEHGFVDMSCS